MELYLWAMGATAAAGIIGTGLGGLWAGTMKGASRRTMSLLLGFAAGMMLGVVCFDLLADALAQKEGEE